MLQTRKGKKATFLVAQDLLAGLPLALLCSLPGPVQRAHRRTRAQKENKGRARRSLSQPPLPSSPLVLLLQIYDHADLQPRPLRSPLLPPVAEEGPAYPTTLFGPTCDGLDTVCRGVLLPRLRAGDFVVFPKFGEPSWR